ncbi:unnamed protein product, partial [Mesorhabditis spiculigera]
MDLYKTLKRQISGSVGDGQSTSGAKYGGGSGKTWIHPPDVLLNGRVEYTVRMLGSREVPKAKGTDTIRDAIHAIRFQRQVKEGETGHAQREKLQRVDLQINVEGLIIVDSKTKMVLYRYPLQRISFCADDKQDKRVFSFIAKAEDSNRHDCFVFMAEKVAEQITLTVGEAFDLAYKRFMDKNRINLENQKSVLLLKKRIVDLEEENQALTRLLESFKKQNQALMQSPGTPIRFDAPPALPTTPMPRSPPTLPSKEKNAAAPAVPPKPANMGNEYGPAPKATLPDNEVNFMDLLESSFVATPAVQPVAAPVPVTPPTRSESSPPPSLAPPPPIVPRRKDLPSLPQPSTSAAPQPEVGRRLDALNFNKMEDIFDDSFDPRGIAKKEEKKNDDPFGDQFFNDCIETATKAEKQTAADIEKMISQVDQRLAEMNSGFGEGQLEVGDTGDALQDIDAESEYSVPGLLSKRTNGDASK